MAADSGMMEGVSEDRMHGRMGLGLGWAAPKMVTEYDVNARLTFTDIKAHEYVDQPVTMAAKVQVLARLIRAASNMIVYTGAGISTSSGIDDYATKAKTDSVTAQDRPILRDWKEARPTRAHRVLVALAEAGLLKHWVQQNHDSLPQKAGYSQRELNEIHGSLHDPANPIVPYEGVLRDDLFVWMHTWQERADLCLAMGTSMSGFNADDLPLSIGRRFVNDATGLGLVIINLQQTAHDGESALRIFGKLDDVLSLLADELGLSHTIKPMDTEYHPNICKGCLIDEDVFQVPFDSEGQRSETETTIWDLRLGRHVVLTGGPYQGDIGVITGKSPEGHYSIAFRNSVNRVLGVRRRPFTLWLGSWWLEMATHGHGICPGSTIPLLSVSEDVVANLSAAEATLPVVHDFSKYQTMQKIGLPQQVIRQKMQCDEIPLRLIDEYFSGRGM